MYPSDYECDGQLNIWDYLSSTTTCEHSGHTCNKKELWKVADSLDEVQCPHVCCRKCNTRMCGARCNGSEEPMPKAEPDDSICEGCKWRDHKDRELEVDEYGQTWVYKCPGTACANWMFGTPLNLSAQKPSKDEVIWYEPEEVIWCFNRDFLPGLEHTIEIIKRAFELDFTSYEADWNKPDNPTVYKHVFKKHSYLEISEGTYSGTDTRFIAVDWEGHKEGTSWPCDNLDRIFRAINNAIYRNEHMKKPKKEEDNEEG